MEYLRNNSLGLIECIETLPQVGPLWKIVYLSSLSWFYHRLALHDDYFALSDSKGKNIGIKGQPVIKSWYIQLAPMNYFDSNKTYIAIVSDQSALGEGKYLPFPSINALLHWRKRTEQTE